MFTIKYTDQDGYERVTTGQDIRAVMDGRQARSVGWVGAEMTGRTISYPTIVYVMNSSGATVCKYVVIGSESIDVIASSHSVKRSEGSPRGDRDRNRAA